MNKDLSDELTRVVDALIAKGAPKDELQMWAAVFPLMESTEQAELLENLKLELVHRG